MAEEIKALVPVKATEDPTNSNVPATLDRNTLPDYQEAQLVKNAKRTVPRMFRALNKLLDQGDKKAVELAAEIYQYRKSGNNISIATNILRQTNNINGEPTGGRSVWFESIVQKIEKEKNTATDIIDAEVIEPDEK